MGLSPAVSGLLGGMSGGIAQAYATMGQSRSTTISLTSMMHTISFDRWLVLRTMLPQINHLSGLTLSAMDILSIPNLLTQFVQVSRLA